MSDTLISTLREKFVVITAQLEALDNQAEEVKDNAASSSGHASDAKSSAEEAESMADEAWRSAEVVQEQVHELQEAIAEMREQFDTFCSQLDEEAEEIPAVDGGLEADIVKYKARVMGCQSTASDERVAEHLKISAILVRCIRDRYQPTQQH